MVEVGDFDGRRGAVVDIVQDLPDLGLGLPDPILGFTVGSVRDRDY